MKSKVVKIILLVSLIAHFASAQLANWSPVPSYTNFPSNVSPQINGISRISQMKFHVTNPNKYYCVTAQGGLFLSNNQGSTWTVAPGTETLNSNCASICIDYTNDQNIWLGTGDQNYYTNGQGVYRSTNGGQSFTATSLTNCLVVDIVQNPTNSAEFVAATNKGIYKSTNNGATWAATTPTNIWVCEMKSNAAVNSQTLFACTVEIASRFLRSTDFGTTWTQITSGIVTPTTTSFTQSGARIGVTPSNPNVVYFELVSDGGIIHKSNDGGLNFLVKKNGGSPYLTFYDDTITSGGQGGYNNCITVDRTDPARVWLQSHNTWFSADSGATWNMLTYWPYNLHTDMHEIDQSPHDPNKLYSCNDGGVWLSTDGGNNWVPKSDGIYAFEIGNESSASSLTQKDFVSIGTQDNGRLYGNANGWVTIRGGDDYEKRLFDYNGHIYYQSLNNERQLNHTGTYTTFGLPTPWWYDLAFNRTNANLGFMGFTDVYRCTNLSSASPTWTQISSFGINIRAVHSCIADPNRLYVMLSNGNLYVSNNALSASPSFTSYTVPGGNAAIATIAAMANNANVLYISKNNSVYQSSNGGVSWTNVTFNLPNVNHRRILAEEYGGTQELVFVATNNAVYYKKAGQTSWTNYGTGLPTRKSPTGFSMFDNGTNQARIRYASFGRAIWETPFDNLRAFSAQILLSDTAITCSSPSIQVTDGSVGTVNAPISYTWNFPGGTPASAFTSSAVVSYSSSGLYTISLNITDALNAVSTKTLTRYIQVISCNPDTVPGSAIMAQGSGNYASTSTSLALGNTNSITLSAWIKINSTQPSFAGIIFSGSGGGTGLNFMNGNQLGYHFDGNAGTFNFTGGPVIPQNEWVHVALVTTANNGILYVNGVPYVNNVANAAVNFTTGFNLGNDRDDVSRTMTGEIDEVCIYNRSLSQDEIRELMHLTRNYGTVDPNLIAYYQCNEMGSMVFNRSGNVHATLKSFAVHLLSTAPVGSGRSERMTINTPGVKTFTAEGLNMTFPNAALPNGEICLTRLNIQPDSVPVGSTFASAAAKYWIINNYGNAGFNALLNFSLTGYGAILPNEALAPQKFKLYRRATGGWLASGWNLIDSAYGATSGTDGVLTYSGSAITFFNTQYTIIKKACIAPVAASPVPVANPICKNTTSTLSANGGVLNDATAWQWYTDSCGGVLVGTGNTFTVSPTVTTTYYVRGEGSCVTANQSTCNAVTLTVITVPQTPLSLSGATAVCAGSGGNIYSVSPVVSASSYSWSLPGGWLGSSSTNTLSVLANGTAGTVSAVAINSCGTSPAASIHVAINTTVAASQTVNLCAGEVYTLGTNSYSATGIYTYALVRMNGCDSIVTSNIVVDPTIDVSTTVSGITLAANASGATYQWINCDNGQPLNGEIGQSFTATLNGNYAVVVTVNNCNDTSGCMNVRSVGIPNQMAAKGIRVFPNPAINLITVEVPVTNSDFTLYNAFGQQVKRQMLSELRQEVDISGLAAGIYFVKVAAPGFSVLVRLVVDAE